MQVKNTFRKRLFWYFFSVFALFTVILLVFQYSREKRYKVDELDSSLNQVAEIIHSYIGYNELNISGNFNEIENLHHFIPNKETRITIITNSGEVVFDSSVDDIGSMENHINRPEVRAANNQGTGANIRRSATTGLDYYYFARKYDDYLVRVALPYNIETKSFLRAERTFWFVFVSSFVLIWIILFLITGRLGEAITKLKEFAVYLKSGKPFEGNIEFPNNELGFIGQELNDIYYRLEGTKSELELEKERLTSHLNAQNEGVGIFHKDRSTIYHNNNFIHYINLIGEKRSYEADGVFNLPAFSKINTFLHHNLEGIAPKELPEMPRLEFQIHKSGRYFSVQSVIFNDLSFEVTISDITRPEKRRILKQQMTANIAHELKTPVSSVIGYLESILETPEMDPETQKHFLEKAYSHADRLADLINDIAILNKIEESGDNFEFEEIEFIPVMRDTYDMYAHILEANNMEFQLHVGSDIRVRGNRSLIHSIFQNLVENAIKYAGKNTVIEISHFHEDSDFHHFSFKDNGKGVNEKHLKRLFERFYRVDKGRTRKMGGTGLGLAIVKNAILMHKGDISVKNVKEGGLEFLFSLPKA